VHSPGNLSQPLERARVRQLSRGIPELFDSDAAPIVTTGADRVKQKMPVAADHFQNQMINACHGSKLVHVEIAS
jgi:hypothetical protein